MCLECSACRSFAFSSNDAVFQMENEFVQMHSTSSEAQRISYIPSVRHVYSQGCVWLCITAEGCSMPLLTVHRGIGAAASAAAGAAVQKHWQRSSCCSVQQEPPECIRDYQHMIDV
jgi:hypothetical protein